MSSMNSYGVRVRRSEVGDADSRFPYLMGLEVELENVELDNNIFRQAFALWGAHSDASLRNGLEFVSSRPISGHDVETAVTLLGTFLRSYDAGPRTSTHIHINISDVDDEVVRSMVFLSYFLEEGVYRLTEESRKWAGYSMPLREMNPDRLRRIVNPFSNRDWHTACTDVRNAERYYGLNVNWSRHGTVEFRYFPGGPSTEEFLDWADYVTLVRKVAGKYTVQELSSMAETPSALSSFILSEFGEWGRRILGVVSPEALFEYYNEVAGLCGDSVSPVSPGICYISAPVQDFIERKIFQADPNRISFFREMLTEKALAKESLQSMLILCMDQVEPSPPEFIEEEDVYYHEDTSEDEEIGRDVLLTEPLNQTLSDNAVTRRTTGIYSSFTNEDLEMFLSRGIPSTVLAANRHTTISNPEGNQ